jgi:hypothetical protein
MRSLPASALGLLTVTLLVAGCANYRGYEKAGVTETQAKKDMRECRYNAEVYDRGIIPPLVPDPTTKARVLHDSKAYRACMIERGYTDIGWSPFREWKSSGD